MPIHNKRVGGGDVEREGDGNQVGVMSEISSVGKRGQEETGMRIPDIPEMEKMHLVLFPTVSHPRDSGPPLCQGRQELASGEGTLFLVLKNGAPGS
ncbi:hypothetical protein CEXT_269041 [Caerostris extrusa]|uniref:Uncharacterized protein n=1 Tax=Caerostris extrusa TaxID=172846 RepID=A0AAV4R6Y8_CAEEX|nr:hypothetical protein CEXT_269041 [Caerostris extrusa]